MLSKLVAIGAVAIALAIAVILFTGPANNNQVPQVKFVSFTPDRDTISVGQSATISLNVQSSEPRNITGAKVITVIEPPGYQQYLKIDKPTIDLPALQNKGARTGDISVSITATSAPANEATYSVKGILYVDGIQTDMNQLNLKVTQQ